MITSEKEQANWQDGKLTAVHHYDWPTPPERTHAEVVALLKKLDI
jgi:hypothetical protein